MHDNKRGKNLLSSLFKASDFMWFRYNFGYVWTLALDPTESLISTNKKKKKIRDFNLSTGSICMMHFLEVYPNYSHYTILSFDIVHSTQSYSYITVNPFISKLISTTPKCPQFNFIIPILDNILKKLIEEKIRYL